VAQQRGSEAQACKQALEQAEQRWTEEVQTLNTSLATAQEEANSLRNQLDEARKMRFSLQTLAAELRGALHASLEQGKVNY
jgi:predicted  nucleic acid-binding Zn-ribbon protein